MRAVKTVYLKHGETSSVFSAEEERIQEITDYQDAVEIHHSNGEILHIPEHNVAAVKFYADTEEESSEARSGPSDRAARCGDCEPEPAS